jgi:hypothetical protein
MALTLSKLKSYYRIKAEASFKTKLNLYLFQNVINNNQKSIDPEEFISFKITYDIVNQYTTEYWQDKPINNMIPKAIYNTIKDTKVREALTIKELKDDYVGNQFKNIFKFEDFIALIERDKCEYCDQTEEQITLLRDNKLIKTKSMRGHLLEIDRYNSNFEYSKENCVLACYWCNNAKTDEFNQKEFKAIGIEIKKIWKNRLNNKIIN